MSTRGSTWCDDQPDDMDWTPTPKPWCPECCTSNCGCPTGERLDDEDHITRGTE